MSGLRQSSKVLNNLGNLCIITGKITGAGSPALTNCNDASVSIADTGTGDFTLTYDAFTSAPQVFCQVLKATHSATVKNFVTVEQATTTTAEVRFHAIQSPGTHPAVLTGSTTWDPATSIAANGQESKEITVTGAALGDVSMVSLGVDTIDVALSSAVTATDTVTATLFNMTASSVDLSTSTATAITWTPAAATVAVAGTSPDPAATEHIMFCIIGIRNK